jgi:hypothetical protein
MVCWPDLWHRVLGQRWLAEPAVVLVIIAMLLWAPGIRQRWLQIALRVVGWAAALIVVAIMGLAVLLFSGDPKPQYRTLNSPNGLHQVTLMYQPGFLGRDFTSVDLTSKGCCEHFTAYEYEGPSDMNGTTILWLDNSHLQIEYYTDHERYQHCEAKVADVTITCTPLMPREN